MDSDSWARLSISSSSSSRRFSSRSDPFHLLEETDGEDEPRPEYICPFCAEDFDIVGLCCHIDEEHTVEAKNGVCPVCARKVGMDLVSHITMQHGSLLKVQRKRRFRKGGSNSTLSILKKELREGNLQSIFGGGSSYMVSSTNTEPDPWLSSFMSNPPSVEESKSVIPNSSSEASSVLEGSTKDSSCRNVQKAPLSDKDQEEKARRSEFVQGLLLSTFLGDEYL